MLGPTSATPDCAFGFKTSLLKKEGTGILPTGGLCIILAITRVMEEGRLQKFRLINRLASGGMGEVFLARQEGPAGFAKTVVVKRILKHLSSDESFVEMFLNEARLAALISHPNVVQIFDLGQEDGVYFISMEYVHGQSLRAIKKKLAEKNRLLSPTIGALICAQALHGLHYAHQLTDMEGKPLQLVHRDVSPENILVGFNGQVKLVDFGIAKAAGSVSTTQAGSLKGKFHYMAPEQITGGRADPRSDVYSMGVLMYEILTGTRPFKGQAEPELLHSVIHANPPRPREVNPELPEVLEAIILKAMQKSPDDRYGNAEGMIDALEEFIDSTGSRVGRTQITQVMKDLFGADASVGADMLFSNPNPPIRTATHSAQRISAELADNDIPIIDAELVMESPTVGKNANSATQMTPSFPGGESAPLASRRRWGIPLAVVAATAGAAAFGGWYFFRQSRNDALPSSGASAPSPPTESPRVASAPTVAQPPPDKADTVAKAYLDEAEKMMKATRYGAASELIQKAKEANPTDPTLNIRFVQLRDQIEVNDLLSQAHFRLTEGDAKIAIALINKAMNRDPQNQQAVELLSMAQSKLVSHDSPSKKQRGRTERESRNSTSRYDPKPETSRNSGQSPSASPTANDPKLILSIPNNPPVSATGTGGERTPSSPPTAAVTSPPSGSSTAGNAVSSPPAVASKPTSIASVSSAPMPASKPVVRVRLPASFRVKTASDLTRVLGVIERESVRAGGVSEQVGHNVTVGLSEDLASSTSDAHGLDIHPLAIYNFIVTHANQGEGRGQIAAALRNAAAAGQL